MRDTEEYKYEWWLAGMRPLTDDKKRARVEHWGSAREVYNGIYYIEERQKKQLHFLSHFQAKARLAAVFGDS